MNNIRMLVMRKEWEQSWTKCGEADLIKGPAQGSCFIVLVWFNLCDVHY